MKRICINCETTFDSSIDTCPKCQSKHFWEREIEEIKEVVKEKFFKKNKKEEKEEDEDTSNENINEEDK
jgi:hypothetical protein